MSVHVPNLDVGGSQPNYVSVAETVSVSIGALKALQGRIPALKSDHVRLVFSREKGFSARECLPPLCLIILQSRITYLELEFAANVEEYLGELGGAISRMSYLRALKLSDGTFDASLLATALASPTLSRLTMSKCSVGASDIGALESALTSSSLVELSLYDSDVVDNVLKRRSAVSLLHRVFDGSSNVRTMNLHNVKISDDGCDSLVRLIREPQCALRHLNISGCTMSSRGRRMLDSAASEASDLGTTTVELCAIHELKQHSPNPFETRFSGAETGDWDSANASSGEEQAVAPGARARRTIHREITPITNCPHTDARHHAKGMCLPCYRRFRDRVNAGLERDTGRRPRGLNSSAAPSHGPSAPVQHQQQAHGAGSGTEFRSGADADDSGHSDSGGEGGGKEDEDFVPSRAAAAGAPRRFRLGKITCCPHVNAKHHAKGMCLPCYRHARDRINAGIDRDFPGPISMSAGAPAPDGVQLQHAICTSLSGGASENSPRGSALHRANRAPMKISNCPHKDAKHHAKGMCLPCYRRKRERINAGLEPEFPAEGGSGLVERAARTSKRVRGGAGLLEGLQGDSETGSEEEEDEHEREHDRASVASSNGSSDGFARRPFRRGPVRRPPHLAISTPSPREGDASPSEFSPSTNLAEFSGLGIHSGSERGCGKRFRDRDSDLFRQYIVPRAGGRPGSELDGGREGDGSVPTVEEREEGDEREEAGRKQPQNDAFGMLWAAAQRLRSRPPTPLRPAPTEPERGPAPQDERASAGQLFPLPVPLPAALVPLASPPNVASGEAQGAQQPKAVRPQAPEPVQLPPAAWAPQPQKSVKAEGRGFVPPPEPGQAVTVWPEGDSWGPVHHRHHAEGRHAPYEVPRHHMHASARNPPGTPPGTVSVAAAAAFVEAERAREEEERQKAGRRSAGSKSSREGEEGARSPTEGEEKVSVLRPESPSVPPSVVSSEDETVRDSSRDGPSRGSSARTPPAMVHLSRVSGNAPGLVVSVPYPAHMCELLRYASLQFGREVVEVWDAKYNPVWRLADIACSGESVYYAITADDLMAN